MAVFTDERTLNLWSTDQLDILQVVFKLKVKFQKLLHRQAYTEFSWRIIQLSLFQINIYFELFKIINLMDGQGTGCRKANQNTATPCRFYSFLSVNTLTGKNWIPVGITFSSQIDISARNFSVQAEANILNYS